MAPSLWDVSIVVRRGGANVAEFQMNGDSVSPAFLRFGGSRFLAASHADYSLLGPPSLYPGASSPVKPGEVVLIWGPGLGCQPVP
jgi:uncharacterized protein (TIGR03437 family)